MQYVIVSQCNDQRTGVICDPIQVGYVNTSAQGRHCGRRRGWLSGPYTHIQIFWDLPNSPEIAVRRPTHRVDMSLQFAVKPCSNICGFQYCRNDAFSNNMALLSCPLASTTTNTVLMSVCCRKYRSIHVVVSV